MTKQRLSTFEREMKNPAFKKAFEKEYKKFLFSEFLVTLMEGDEKSVRKLAKEVGLSPTVVQKIRSGKQDNIKISNFVNLVNTFGYKVVLEKGNERIVVEDEHYNNQHHLHFAHAA